MFKVVSKKEIEKLWLPMKEIIHGNAILGKIVEDKVFYVKIFGRSKPEKADLEESVEALTYKGSDNDLSMSQRFKLEYRCEFSLQNYPFDEQICNFIMKMSLKGNNSIKLMEKTFPIIYSGAKILQQFELKNFFVNTTLKEFETKFIYNMQLERLFMQALSTTFFQSFLLWLIAYFTLYINIQDFTNRFMGALTSLLVLAALLTSINASLPQTAYFKHIDIWFFCFVINISVIVFVHIFVDIVLKRGEDFGLTKSLSKIAFQDLNRNKISNLINQIAKIVLAAVILVFLFIYFMMTLVK